MNKKYELNETRRFATLWEMVDYNAKNRGSQIAFQYVESNELVEKTYLDFKRDVCAIVQYLNLIDEKKIVSIIGANSYIYIVAWFAITSSGNIVVPLDRQRKNSDLDFLIKDSNSDIVLYGDNLQDFVNHYVEVDEDKVHFISLNKLKDDLIECEKNMAEVELSKVVSENDVAAILYTSGTTSNSKGVLLSHKNFCADAYGSCCNIYLDRMTFHILPWHHVYGLIGLLCTFSLGTTNFISLNPKKMIEELKMFQPKVMIVVPLYVESLYKIIMMAIKKMGIMDDFNERVALSRKSELEGRDIRRETFKDIRGIISEELETLISGGAVLDSQYIQFFHDIGIELRDGYGITECAAVITVNRDFYFKEGSVGLPIPICQIKINDSKDGVGEVVVKGDNVMLGYYNDEQANKDSFIDGWYRTGDIGYIDEDGFLFLKGRIKNLIISKNGENVCPEELEGFINKYSEVKEVVVYLKNEQYIAAEIFPDMDYIREKHIDDYETKLKNKIDELNKTLPPYKVIEEVLFRDQEFQKNSSKKIIRYKL